MTWPKELGDDFINLVKDLRPIEQKVEYPLPPDKDLILSLRRRYQSHIEDELPKLAKLIGARWSATAGLNPAFPPGGDRPEMPGWGSTGPIPETAVDQALVDWSIASQQEIVQQHFRWGTDMSSPTYPGVTDPTSGESRSPNLLEILYAQEDLWILQAIMNVIRKTNEGATARYNAAIKELIDVRLGKQAVPSRGRIRRLRAASSDGAASGDDQTMQYPSDDGAAPTEGGREHGGHGGSREHGGGYGDTGEEGTYPDQAMSRAGPDPAEGRYVDRDYQPLSAARLRSAMKEPANVPAEDAYLLVAKRIPVRMRVKIDQVKLDRFLVECANSPLTIEVRQVRVNPVDDADAGFNPGYPMGLPPMNRPSREGGGIMPPSMPFSGSAGFPSLVEALDAQSRTDLIVEVYGIVYFYNPVSEQLLGQVSAEDAAAEGTKHVSWEATGCYGPLIEPTAYDQNQKARGEVPYVQSGVFPLKKKKADSPGIVDLFVQHGEKMVLGLIAVLALFLIYSGFRARQGLPADKTPKSLADAVTQTTGYINSFKWDQHYQKDRDLDQGLLDRANETLRQIDESHYETRQVMKPAYHPMRTTRTDPVLFAAYDLQARAGFGLMPGVAREMPMAFLIRPRILGNLAETPWGPRMVDVPSLEDTVRV